MKFRVCHISTLHPAKDTRIFQKQCVSLAANGFEVHLIVANQKSEFAQGVQIHSITSPTANRLQRMRKTANAAFEKALALDAALYHFHDPELFPIGLKLQAKGKHVIFDSHEDVPLQIYNKPYLPKPLRPIVSGIYKRYEKSAASKLSAIVVANPPDENRMGKMNSNTEGIYNFPRIDNSVVADWSTKKNEIVYVGTLLWERGIKEMVQSLENVETLLNLGGNWHVDKYKKEIEALPSWKKVNPLGFVNRSQINELYNRSKIGLSTLLPVENYKRIYSVKMFEYMAAGLPVVVSDFPLFKEVVEEINCGICVDATQPQAIAEAVNYLLANDDIAEQMGKNGRKAVEEKYNWKTQEKKLIDLYNRLLN